MVCLFGVEVDNLSKFEESQYTINFQCKLICIGIVWTPEGLVLHHPFCRNPLLFSQKAGLCCSGNSYSGTSSLLPAGGHWVTFVVAVVQDSQQQVLPVSGIRNLGSADLKKAADSSWWESIWKICHSLFLDGDQIFQNQVPNENEPVRLELDVLWLYTPDTFRKVMLDWGCLLVFF